MCARHAAHCFSKVQGAGDSKPDLREKMERKPGNLGMRLGFSQLMLVGPVPAGVGKAWARVSNIVPCAWAVRLPPAFGSFGFFESLRN